MLCANPSPDSCVRGQWLRKLEVGGAEPPGEPVLWVPFLYREALSMVQGSAISGQDDAEQLELDL